MVQIAVQVRALIDCQNAALAMTQIAVISRTFRTRKSRSECRWFCTDEVRRVLKELIANHDGSVYSKRC